jgi:hypothetical protein
VGPKAGVKYTGKHGYPVISDLSIDDVKVHWSAGDNNLTFIINHHMHEFSAGQNAFCSRDRAVRRGGLPHRSWRVGSR